MITTKTKSRLGIELAKVRKSPDLYLLLIIPMFSCSYFIYFMYIHVNSSMAAEYNQCTPFFSEEDSGSRTGPSPGSRACQVICTVQG